MNNIVIILGVVVTVLTGVPVMIQLMRHHPKGLFVLFFAEMWERFSYYGMRGLLIFYLTQHFLFGDRLANSQYGAYTTLVYLLPLIGGYLADRYLGARKAVVFGALLLVLGHFGMAIEGKPAQQALTYQGHQYTFVVTGRTDTRQVHLLVAGRGYEFGPTLDGGLRIKGLEQGGPLPSVLAKGSYELTVVSQSKPYIDIFYLSLALIIMGVGYLKANISSIVGQLYQQGDPRRDPGFTLYYYGINLGAFWASVLCGYLGQTIGWWAGFGLAGVGMLAGLLFFVLGKSWLQGKGEPPDPARLRRPYLGPISREGIIYICGLIGVAVVMRVVQPLPPGLGETLNTFAAPLTSLMGIGHDQPHVHMLLLLLIGSAGVLGYIGWFMAARCDRIQRERLGLALVLVFGAVVFFTLFEQAGTSLNLFADRNTDLNIISHPVVWNLGGRQILWASQTQLDRLAASGAQLGNMLWIDMGVTAAQTQSFNSGFILILAPLFAALWEFLGRRRRDPNPVLKFGLGLIQVGLGFLILVFGAAHADSAFRLPLAFLGAAYLLHTTGELCLSPVGMSEITKLSPAVIVSTMMATWFLASSWAQYIAGIIAGLAGTETVGGQVLDPRAALHSSIGVFQTIGWAGVAFGVGFLALSPLLKHWAHGADDTGPIAPAQADL